MAFGEDLEGRTVLGASLQVLLDTPDVGSQVKVLNVDAVLKSSQKYRYGLAFTRPSFTSIAESLRRASSSHS